MTPDTIKALADLAMQLRNRIKTVANLCDAPKYSPLDVALDRQIADLLDRLATQQSETGPITIPFINPDRVEFNPADVGISLVGEPEPYKGSLKLESVSIYRDIFAEITAKAIPVCDPTSEDPDRVRHYIVPVGPIHRAAGRTGFQMFDGEKHLADAIAKIRELETQQSGDGVREAMTPSAATKAAYSGEFKFDIPMLSEDGEVHPHTVTVPWTTIKEIMAAIAKRDRLSDRVEAVQQEAVRSAEDHAFDYLVDLYMGDVVLVAGWKEHSAPRWTMTVAAFSKALAAPVHPRIDAERIVQKENSTHEA